MSEAGPTPGASGTTIAEVTEHLSANLLEVKTWRQKGDQIIIKLNKENDPFNTMQLAMKPFAEPKREINSDPKTALNQFCQRYCKKAISKSDFSYATVKVDNKFQCTLKLHCLEDLEFAGEPCSDSKTAEQSAAQMALTHFAETVTSVPTIKKRKTENDDGTMSDKKVKVTVQVPLTLTVPPLPVAKKPIKAEAPHAAGNSSAKDELNVLCRKIAKTTLTKSDMIYGVQTVPGGYMATVTIPALPGEWATKVWTGETSAKKPDAEQSAAAMAVATLKTDPSLTALRNEPTGNEKRKAGSKGGGKGKGKYKGGMDVMGGMGGAVLGYGPLGYGRTGW